MSPGFEGRWQPLRAELAGEPAPPEVLEKTEVEFGGGNYAVRFGGAVADRGTYAHDPAAPGTLMLAGLEGPNAGRLIPCIYQLVGDRLRICYGLDGNPPAIFATTATSRAYLVTYRRQTS